MSTATPSPPQGRLDFVDLVRGLALLAMAIYHFAYDLSFFGLIETDVPTDPAWRIFARSIAGSFLVLVGFSLVLATRKRLNGPAILKRLGTVVAAAALVTVGTAYAIPQDFIFFGILHHIALASVLALLFLRLPTLAIAAAAVASFALPSFIAAEWLDEPWLVWLGFSRLPLRSADFVPLFPWFGCTLAGMVLGRLALPHLQRLGRWRARAMPSRVLAWSGRHSLFVYLVHQPVLIGSLLLAMQLGLGGDREAQAFLRPCELSCRQGSDPQSCAKLCSCAMTGLKREDLWRKTLDDTLLPAETARAREIGQACARR